MALTTIPLDRVEVSSERTSARPLYVAGSLAAFVGLSVANVLPPIVQIALYLIGVVAVSRRPHRVRWVAAHLVMFAGMYLLLIKLAMGVELEGALRVIRPCFEGFLLAHVLYKWCRIRNFRAVAVVLGGVIAIQFVVALVMAINPAGRTELLNSIYSDESYQSTEFTGALLFRGYGLSRHHLYGFPLEIGLSAALLLVAASIDRTRISRIALGATATAGLLLVAVNARIGFVPVVMCYGIGASVLFDKLYLKHLLAVTVLLLLPVLYFGAVYFGDQFEIVLTWLAAGVAQFGGADRAGGSTLSDLRAMLVLSPNVMDVLFGVGRVCTTNDPCYSDIGFIRAIQEGGVIFLLLVLALYWHLNQHLVGLFRRTIKLRDRGQRRAATLLAIVAHATFIAAMVKGEAFGPNDYSRLVSTLACLDMLAGKRLRMRRAARSETPLEIAQRAPDVAHPLPLN